MRDDFTKATKEILAKRVAWRCSFLGCNRITIGPGQDNSSQIVNVGEAAHITAASLKGPRYDDQMSPQERVAVDNGIWMCRQHAKMIDSDFQNYSAQTLHQWKKIAEQATYAYLKNLRKEPNYPTTLVALGDEIIFEGIWKSVNDGIWKFAIESFVIGGIKDVVDFNDKRKVSENYIVIETQGDGRFLEGNLNWEFENDQYIISLTPGPKSTKTTPYNLSGMSAKFELENGSIKILKGEEYAKQAIEFILGIQSGEVFFSPKLGSFISNYYWQFKSHPQLLSRMIKLEITRLISLPYKGNIGQNEKPLLGFINRVLDIKIPNLELVNQKLLVQLKLEWGDGKNWEDEIYIFIKNN